MEERSIDPVADILVAIVWHGKKDYVKSTTTHITTKACYWIFTVNPR